jgi:hypothetical protein
MIADGVTATQDQVHGLTHDEIDEVEQDQSAPLAETYRTFLELAGRHAAHFQQGTDAFYPSILGLGHAARELLAENRVTFTWRHDDRVFLMHQGYYFEFLRGAGPDPEVWYYSEGPATGQPTFAYSHFTDWLADEIRQQTQAWAHIKSQRGRQHAEPER